MKTIENLKSLASKNSDHLVALELNLDVIESLETQVGWLQESFEEAAFNKDDLRGYFREWQTNLLVIHSLFNHVTKKLHEDCKNLRHLSEGIMEEIKEEADALTSAQ